jgi:hypothetical protein
LSNFSSVKKNVKRAVERTWEGITIGCARHSQ